MTTITTTTLQIFVPEIKGTKHRNARVIIPETTQRIYLGCDNPDVDEAAGEYHVYVGGEGVCANHAQLSCDSDGVWTLEDQGSPAGTKMAGDSVTRPTALQFNLEGVCPIRLGRRIIYLKHSTAQ